MNADSVNPPGLDETAALMAYMGTDAVRWAERFCSAFMVTRKGSRPLPMSDDGEGLMLTWFANAIMAGYDDARRRWDPELRATLRDLGIDP